MSSSPWPSDEGARFLVDQVQQQLLGHLPAEMAAEVEECVDRGDIEFSPRLTEMSVQGDLAFRSGGKVWHLAPDEDDGHSFVQVDGHSFVQVTVIDENGTFASTSYQDGEEVGSHLDHYEERQVLRRQRRRI